MDQQICLRICMYIEECIKFEVYIFQGKKQTTCRLDNNTINVHVRMKSQAVNMCIFHPQA